jgi:gluconolactonase
VDKRRGLHVLILSLELVNNYYGRQFNSLNDVAVNPANGHIYFTDVTYGYLQDFRPAPVLKNQVYKLDSATKALTVVADDQINNNGKSLLVGYVEAWKD